jgi:hypothetical protein
LEDLIDQLCEMSKVVNVEVHEEVVMDEEAPQDE